MLTTPIIIAGIFFLIGLGIMAAGAMTYLKGNKVSGWATTQGQVVVSQINRSTGSNMKFFGFVEYEYTVAGNIYRSKTVTPAELMGISDTTHQAATEKVAKYPAGKRIAVIYDPSDPQKSVLEKGGDSSLFILGGIFMVFGIVILIIQ
jgi:hypothetical protein